MQSLRRGGFYLLVCVKEVVMASRTAEEEKKNTRQALSFSAPGRQFCNSLMSLCGGLAF